MGGQTRIGERIKLWRWAKGLTQTEVARACGVRQSCIADLESGRRAIEAPEKHLPHIATLFGVPERYLREDSLHPLQAFLRESDEARRRTFARKLASASGQKIPICWQALGDDDPPRAGLILRLLLVCCSSSALWG